MKDDAEGQHPDPDENQGQTEVSRRVVVREGESATGEVSLGAED